MDYAFAPDFELCTGLEGAIKNAVPLNEQKSCGGKGTALGLDSPRGYLVLGPDWFQSGQAAPGARRVHPRFRCWL
jgi:hypothetical protein